MYGAPDDAISLEEAASAVTIADGRAANLIARMNQNLRELRSRDAARLDVGGLAVRKVGDRWYHLIDGLLVDERVDERTEVILVRFASEAYFDLVAGRVDLRPALAAARNVMVMVTAQQAVLVSDETGIERFSQEHMEHFGLLGR